jgi:hypothetical protein
MMHDPTALAANFLQALHDREVYQDAPDSVRRFAEAYQALRSVARQTDPATQNLLLHALTEGLPRTQSNWEFGCLANTCGMIVECGGDPAIAIEPILDRLTEQFERVPSLVALMQSKLGIEHPNGVAETDWPKLGTAYPEHAWTIGEWYALQWMGCAAMAMLCRDAESRKKARARVDLMESAESARNDNPYAFYLAELLATGE